MTVTMADAAAIARDMQSSDEATSNAALRVVAGMDRLEHLQLVIRLTSMFELARVDLDRIAARARAWEATR